MCVCTCCPCKTAQLICTSLVSTYLFSSGECGRLQLIALLPLVSGCLAVTFRILLLFFFSFFLKTANLLAARVGESCPQFTEPCYLVVAQMCKLIRNLKTYSNVVNSFVWNYFQTNSPPPFSSILCFKETWVHNVQFNILYLLIQHITRSGRILIIKFVQNAS